MRYVVGVDLGGTKINSALADLEGNIISKYEIPTNASEGEMVVLNRLISTIEEVIARGNVNLEDVKAIGIGAPGPLNANTGIILDPPNLPFRNFDIVTAVREKFNTEVFLDNDANAAAIGEYMFGAGIGTNYMVYLTASTGVGGGAVLNGKVYRGKSTNGVELGHTTVDPFSEIRCNCGNKGCLEAFASGTAIGKRGREAAETGVETTLKKYENITSAEVFIEAAAGDKVAMSIRDNALRYLGIGVVNAITTFDPDMVVIGGGVTKAGEVIFDKVKEVVNERGLKAITEGCQILPAKLGTDAGVVGAVALAILESK